MSDHPIDFATEPAPYRHWRLAVDAPVATLRLTVTPDAGLSRDYELKLNSYDLAVDIELNDIVQRLRFEHPEVKTVVLTGGARQGVLRRCQHPDAGRARRTATRSTSASSPTRPATASRTPRPTVGPDVDRRRQRHRRRRRLRAGAGLRRDRARRRSRVDRVAPRGAAARRAPGHRRPDPARRQASRPPRPRRRLRHHGPRGSRAAQALDWGLVDAIAPRSAFDDARRASAPSPGPPPPTARPAARHRAHPARRGRSTATRSVRPCRRRPRPSSSARRRSPSRAA